MAIYMINGEEMQRLDETTFNAEGIRERQDLQRLLRESIGIVAPATGSGGFGAPTGHEA